VKKIRSPRAVGVSNPCNDQGQWAGNTNKGSTSPVPASESYQFTTGKSSATEDPQEAQSHMEGKGVRKAPNISEGLWLEKQGRREEGKGPPGSSQEKGQLKTAYLQMGTTPFQAMHQCKEPSLKARGDRPAK